MTVYVNRHNTHILLGFEYHAPASVAEAVKLLDEYGPEAKALAGGTDLIVRMKDGSVRPRHVVNLKWIPGLSGIRERRDGVWIGALTRLRDVELSELVRKRLPVLHEAVRVIGSVQIRNLATIGGNICNASPAADGPVALLALDAKAHITGPSGDRAVDLGSFFTGPGRTVLSRGEILTGVTVPRSAAGGYGCFIRVGRVSMDIATISLAAYAKLKGGAVEDCRLAWGTVAPTPMRTTEVEDFLKGRSLDDKVISEAAELASKSIRPRERGRSSGPYKRRVAYGFTVEALTRIAESARRGRR
jgi:carbon-monoxide dehydrogenase medium subunit